MSRIGKVSVIGDVRGVGGSAIRRLCGWECAICRRGYRHANQADFFVAGGAALARNCHSELPENSAPGSAANFLPLRGLFVLRF